MESFTLGLMRGDGAPLYRQLYRHIVEEIASGGLAAGEKLPSKATVVVDMHSDGDI
jgi:GntR family transcriptional regulator/MocR family aminotransferase